MSYIYNLLKKGWAKKQPFRKRLDQKQPFRKRLDQKLQPMVGKVQAKQAGSKIYNRIRVVFWPSLLRLNFFLTIGCNFWPNLFLKGCF
jgi:hypothetical protein